MTQRPRHLVNAQLVLTDEALPETTPVDLALSAGRIEGRHGSATGARYRHFIGRALAAEPHAGRDDLLTLAALAAWRAGALGFRTDALRRLDLALAAGSSRLPALAAALGLDEDDVRPFAVLQRVSRFGWPGLHAPGELLAEIGGFRGLFGPWLAPPVAVLADERPGSFVIRTAPTEPAAAQTGEDWLLSADVFGHTLVRLTPDETEPAAETETAARWAGAGRRVEGLAEEGRPGAVLSIHGYSAQLRLPEATA